MIVRLIQSIVRLFEWIISFIQLGLNEADTLKSSSILIYLHQNRKFIYTKNGLIPSKLKGRLKQTNTKVVAEKVKGGKSY
jgi:hypothetical protein